MRAENRQHRSGIAEQIELAVRDAHFGSDDDHHLTSRSRQHRLSQRLGGGLVQNENSPAGDDQLSRRFDRRLVPVATGKSLNQDQGDRRRRRLSDLAHTQPHACAETAVRKTGALIDLRTCP